MTEIAAYGTWKSPISAADVARGAAGVSYPSIAGGEVWWQERRPSEGGRTTIVASAGPAAEARELLPGPWNARSRVHEYGGKSYLPVPSLSLAGGFDLVFANFADQRLYAVGAAEAAGGEPVPLTPAEGGFRFADLVLSPDGQEIWCVRETAIPVDGEPPAGFHLGGGLAVARAIVAVPLDGSAASDAGAIRVLVSGAHFFAFPTPSPDGSKLAWINWNHPNMPWDGTELRVAPVPGGTGSASTGSASTGSASTGSASTGSAGAGPADTGAGPATVAGSRLLMGGLEESVLAPLWRDDATLYAVSDASGWWNLYEVAAAGGTPRPLHPLDEEFAAPLWQLGGRPFDLLSDGRLAVLHGLGEYHPAILDPGSGQLTDLEVPGYRTADGQLTVSGTTIVTIAGGPQTPWSVLRIGADGDADVVKEQPVAAPDAAYLPDARPVQLSGEKNGDVVHALVHPPSNPGATGPDGELPPFIVSVHGGPTSQAMPVLSMEKAYFTSRGIGVIDVNYGGSTGYGREYRNRLRGKWGIVDVADAYTAALRLAESGAADRARLGIRGGSAGGWTTLVAVTSGFALTGTKEAVFSAATSYYGVSDLRPFVADTHDFESRYLDSLIGPLPEAEEIYEERAPVGHVNELTCPILLLQGLDDPIVPPSQSEAIAADLAEHHIPHAYIAFEGESHGFRKAETIIASLEAELAFYGDVFGFTPPGVPPLELS